MFHMKQRVIAIANQKGGVGKTTTAINLAHNITLADQTCLLVDIDPQANASSGLGITPDDKAGVYPLLTESKTAEQSILSSLFSGLDVLPACSLLSDLASTSGAISIEANALKSGLSRINRHYNYILIDCPPAWGIFSLNALVAASSIIIPIQCEYFAMEGLSQMLNIVKKVQREYNPELRVEGVVLTMHDNNLQFSREVVAEVTKHLPELVYKTVVPRDVSLAESSSFGQPIMVYSPTACGARGYIEITREILNEREKIRPGA